MALSSSINKLSITISGKNNNRKTNPWYDNDCKNARRDIKEANEESLRIDKINNYKALIKIKKRHYINKKKEHLLRLSKVVHKKFWRQILTSKT